jgi:hypothetical protein
MRITDEQLWEVAKSFDDLIECCGGYYRHHGHDMDRTKAIKILRELLRCANFKEPVVEAIPFRNLSGPC